ncbi:ComEC/Rec2 family competence protein [Polluticoccus soli]|uniref:ComEC/Rec2 family competence protein n=1 Tax=Polluticoccus soli TaxID=3034150 RepID=UPI0023E269E4|nr:ComEC/Rec2 family competence protein [Flavipsychrobacter sp. JY13-12]
MKQWPVNKADFWEQAPFTRLLLPLIAGIAVYNDINLTFNTIITGITICLLLFIVVALARKQHTAVRIVHFVLLHAVVILSAWALCFLNDVRNNKDWFGKQVSTADAFVATIAEPPAEKEKTWKLEVNVLGSIKGTMLSKTSGSAFVYVFKYGDHFPFKQGDTVFLPNNWQPIKNAGNPFEFDYARYTAQHNLYFQQFLAQSDIRLFNRSTSLAWTDEVHNWCMARLQTFISDKQTLGLIQAMLIGDEANLDSELRQAYSETGIIHVIVISGSHIAFFFFIITFCLGWIRSKKYRWIKYALALPLIWAYVLISGAPPSAVRAAIMFSILGVGFIFQKQPNSLNQLFAAAFVLLCVQPMWLYSVGFQLSFIAVLSLIVFYKPIYNLWQPSHAITRGLWGTIVASIAAEILVAPLVVYYFHLFPLMFIIANVAAFLFMGIVLVAGMLIIAFSSMAPVAHLLAIVTTWLTSVFHTFVFNIQQFNPASLLHLNITTIEMVLLYGTITLAAIYFFKKKRPVLFVALATFCVLVISLGVSRWQALHQQRLIVYNINHINHIELIEGWKYSVLNSDTSLTEKQRTYALKPAQVGWYAWEGTTSLNTRSFEIVGKKVLILDSATAMASVPSDYIIVNFKPKPRQLAEINALYHPQKIILGSHVSRSQSIKCKQVCDSLHIPMHATQTDGAFILPGL